jgi:hypothetical protein
MVKEKVKVEWGDVAAKGPGTWDRETPRTFEIG